MHVVICEANSENIFALDVNSELNDLVCFGNKIVDIKYSICSTPDGICHSAMIIYE